LQPIDKILRVGALAAFLSDEHGERLDNAGCIHRIAPYRDALLRAPLTPWRFQLWPSTRRRASSKADAW
jgi:hypothetical protein